MSDIVPVKVPVLVARRVVCPTCGRSEVQHGSLTCGEIDAIAERVAYYRRPWWRRWRRPR